MKNKLEHQNLDRMQTRKVFVRLLRFTIYYWHWFIGIVMLTAILAMSSTVNAELMRRMINSILKKDTSILITTGASLLALVLIISGLNFVKNRLNIHLQNKSTLRLQTKLLDKILRLRSKDLASYHTGDILSRINDSATDALSAINGKMMQLLSNVLQLVFLLSYLSIVNIGLALGSLIITLIIPILATPMSKHMRLVYTKRQEARAMQDSFLMDSMQGLEVIKSYDITQKMTGLFRIKWNHYLKYHLKALFLEAIFYRINIFVYVVGLVYILGYGGYLISQGVLDVGAIVAFLVAFEQLSGPVSNLSTLWPQMQSAISSGFRVFEILDLPEEFHEEPSSNSIRSVDLREIEFNDVTFRYHSDNEPVLQNVSLKIFAGQTTAIVGESGSGKSTIANLLLGLYTLESGDIRIDGQPITEKDMTTWWRRIIGYVPQDPYLISGTIGDNIRFGRPNATEEEVIEVAKLVNIHNWINQLPGGYETIIGERGLTLSGGERQRISIARALLKKPYLLVLDEPTSALDSENERIVQETLEKVMIGRTAIVIAHRLSTIRDADQIVLMHQGRVVEQGTHDELLRINGRYRTLYELGNKERTEESA